MRFPTFTEIEDMAKRTPAYRREISRQSFPHFMAYYFGHYATSPFSGFHRDMADDLTDLVNGKITEAAEVTYRSSAKTSIAKVFTIWCIVDKSYAYINVDSYDRTNSERFLFDVVIELQSNRKLTSDYGRLFDTVKDTREKTQKRVSDFITSNGIRCEAHTTGEPMRGRLHGNKRPQLLVLDDIESRKTMVSEAATREVREHMNEALAGMDHERHSILTLGNYISETGNVRHIMDKLKDRDDARVRLVSIVNEVEPFMENGKFLWRGTGGPTWPERYCLTDAEAELNPKLISLEKMRREMYKPDTGEAEFLLEMMCRPEAYANRSFHRSMFTDIDFREVKDRKTRVFFTVDAGGSSDDDDLTGRDRCGFCVNWVEHDGHWNLKAWGERLGPTALVTKIIDTMSWLTDIGTPCHQFGWEKTQFTNALKGQLEAEMRRRNRMFPIIEIINTKKKEERIKGALLHRYETGMIRHIGGECDDLVTELLMFPDGEHDDCLDSVSFQSNLVPMTFNLRPNATNEKPISKFLA